MIASNPMSSADRDALDFNCQHLLAMIVATTAAIDRLAKRPDEPGDADRAIAEAKSTLIGMIRAAQAEHGNGNHDLDRLYLLTHRWCADHLEAALTEHATDG